MTKSNLLIGAIYKTSNPVSTYQFVKVDKIEDGQVHYTYVNSGKEGRANLGSAWVRSFELQGIPFDVNSAFHVCWCPSTNQSILVSGESANAKDCANQMIADGCKDVVILKPILIAEKPKATFRSL